MKTHNTHNRQTSMPPVGFETTILKGERPQTYALDHAATGTGITGTECTINDTCRAKVSQAYKILVASIRDGYIMKILATLNFSIRVCSMKFTEMPGYSVTKKSLPLQLTEHCRRYNLQNTAGAITYRTLKSL